MFHLFYAGLSESDENCKRFMDRCMPEAFKKVRNICCADVFVGGGGGEGE